MPTVITEPKAFAQFTIEHPWLTKKLIGWARPTDRDSRQILTFAEQATMVESYLQDFVFDRSLDKTQRDARLNNWVGKLSDVERKTLGKFFDISVDLLAVGEEHRDWYFDRGEDYIVLQEPVSECHRYGNELIGVTTTNSYGAQILNTDRMLIVDVDLRSDSSKPVIITDEKYALQTLAYAAVMTKTNWRVYRTAAGLRYFEVSRPFDPTSALTRQLQHLLYTDPLYVTLCRRQETFRARLTPKPWRSGLCHKGSNADYLSNALIEDAETEAVCSFISIVGKRSILPMFATMVDYHDAYTKATPKHRNPKLQLQYKLT